MVSGIIVPNLTPMNDHGVTLGGLEALTEFLITREISALFINGTTGEAPLLSLEERRECAALAIKTANRRLPVIVQVGAENARASLELAVHAAEAGADALACITPGFFSYSDKELLTYYLNLARAVAPLELYLYNIPARTGNTLSAQLAEQLAKEANIVGIKDSSGNMAQILDYLAIPDFAVLPGADLLATQVLVAGARGIVSGPAGVFPEPYVALWKAWRSKDYGALLYWQKVVMHLSRLVGHGARLDILKGLLIKRLPEMGHVRPPLLPAPSEELKTLQTDLKALLEATPLQEDAYNWL